MADEFQFPDPLTPDPLAGDGTPISEIPRSQYQPVDLNLQTLPEEELRQREEAQSQYTREQMTAAGIAEEPPVPPSGIDQAIFNEILPPRARLTTAEVYDIPPPTEKEARDAMNKIVPGASDEEIAQSQRIVNRRLEAQKADAQAEQIDYVQQNYTDENKRKQLAKHPDVANAISLSPDPELVLQTTINNGWLNAVAGRKLSAPELEVQRKAIGKSLFDIPDISQQQFFTKMQGWAKQKDAEKNLLTQLDAAVGSHVLSDQLNRTYTPDFSVLEKLKSENPEVITPENERMFALANQRMHGRMRQLGDKLLEPYSEIFQVVQRAAQEKRDPTPEELNGLVKTLDGIDPENRREIWGMVGRAGRSGLIDPQGLAAVMDNLGKEWGREFNLSDRSIRDQQTQMDDMLKQLDAGAKFGTYQGRFVYAPPGQPLLKGATEFDAQGYAEYRDKLATGIRGIDLLWEAQDAYESIVDPIHPVFKEGLLSVGERGLYNLPGMVKMMALGGVVEGPVGWVAMFDAIRADEYRSARIAHPHMDVADTAAMAGVSAALQAIPEQMQIEIPLGRYGKMLSMERDIARPGFWGGVRTYGKRAAVGLAEENLIEGFQDAVSMFYPAIKSQFDPNMTRQDLGEVAWQWVTTRPEVFAAVLLPAAVGSGVISYHDLKNPMRSVFNSETLRGLGITEAGIENILGKESLDEMQSAFNVEYTNVTPEDRVRGHDYISATAAAAAVKEAEGSAPSFRAVTQADGTKVYQVLDDQGKVVYSNTDSDLAQSAFVDLVTSTTSERLAAEEEQKKSAEGVAAAAESEGTVRLLDEPSRTSASVMLDFTPNAAPTPELSGAVGRLERALANDPRGAGKGIRLVAQDPVVSGATPAGQRLLTTIRGFEGLFGKKVAWVRSATGDALPFTGLVVSTDPNTIFLDADGDRNVLALLGHEWAHTLARNNPTLYKTMVAQMRPLVVDWMRQEGILAAEEGVPTSQVTDELVGNIVGDSFTRPDFWVALNQRNPTLFEKMVQAFQQWWDNLVEAARGSEWGTEEFINNLEQMHGVIADAINQARQAGPEVTAGAAPAEEELSFATRREVEKGFYRRIDEVVSDKLPKSTSPEQAKATLKSANLKAEEIKWTGVIPAIDRIAAENNGKVPKAQLEEHLQNEGDAKFKEVVHGGTKPHVFGTPEEQQAAIDRLHAAQNDMARLQYGTTEYNAAVIEARAAESAMRDIVPGWGRAAGAEEFPTRYETYQLPGGENYREVVLSMPERDETSGRLADLKSKAASGRITPEEANEFRRLKLAGGEPAQRYASSHFPDIPNYVAHMRMNDREGGLFIEEIQSDRHQQAREKGYRPEGKATPEEAKQIFQISDANWAAMDQETRQSYADEVNAGGEHLKGLIPDAPFRKDWPIAMFKRALRDAVATGKQWIGWTTGETQAERYDLSKQVDKISYYPNPDGTYNIVAEKGGSPLVEKRHQTIEEVSGLIGKEMANKIQNGEGTPHPTSETKTFSGLDLKVGGEGMKGFYDKILPNEVGKYVKQWGAKVEEGEIKKETAWFSDYRIAQLPNGKYMVEARNAQTGKWGPLFGAESGVTKEEAQEFLDLQKARAEKQREGIPIWKIEITPQMQESVAQGQLQFATRRSKFEQAKAAGVSKEESVAAAFERLHAEPEKRLNLFEKIRKTFEQVSTRHRAAEARLVSEAPPPQDVTAAIDRLEAMETKALEDLDADEQDALEKSSQDVADRYAERIQAQTDMVKRRALERESKVVAAEKRKAIEKQFDERRKATESDFRRQQQTVRLRVEQANLASTREGAAQLAETQRLHTFAELNAILKALPPEIRGRISPVTSLAQVRATETSLTDFLTKQIGKIDVAIEAALKGEYTGRINNLLDRTEPKTTPAGIKKSTIGPEAQRATDLARGAVKMDNDETSTRLAAIDAALQSPDITEEDQTNLIEEWTVLNSFGDLKNRNAASLASAHQWLDEVVRTGRSAWRLKEEERAVRMKGIRDQITSGLGRGTRAGLTEKELSQGGLAMLSSFGLSHSNFLQFLARILPDNTFMKDWMDRVRRGDNAVQDITIKTADRLMAHMRSTLGIDSRRAMAKAVWKLKEPVKGKVEAYDGRVLDKDGNIIDPGKLEKLTMSRLEALQFLLSWNQPDVRMKMLNQGWTPESIAQMEKLTADPESQAVLAFLQKEFSESYATSNPLYRELFGMDMPQVKNYAPTRFKTSRDAGDIAPFGGPMAASGLTPGYAKARVNHSAMMDQTDALNVLWQHVAQQAHWTNFAAITRELRSVFGNRDVRASIEQAHGKKVLQQVDLWIETIANAGGNKSAEIIVNSRILDALISGKAISALGFSLRTIFAQIDSAMRMVFAMPMGRIAKTLLDPKWITNIPSVWKSDTIQRRIQNGASPEARYLFEQSRIRPSTMLRMGQASMMPVQLADGFLTSLSSSVVFTDSYNQAKAAGRSDAEAAEIAADDMDDAVYRYSQPTGVGSKSLQELTGGQWKKAFMLFMSDPRLKTALYFEAGTNIVKGKGTKMDWQRVIFVHVLAGISQIILNAYRDTFTDDDDKDIWTAESIWKAVLLGPLQGLVFLGTAADAVASKMLGGKYFAPSRDPLLDAIANGGQALKNLDKTFQVEDKKALMREWNAIARAIALHPLFAAPAVIINFLKPIFGLWENLEKTED